MDDNMQDIIYERKQNRAFNGWVPMYKTALAECLIAQRKLELGSGWERSIWTDDVLREGWTGYYHYSLNDLECEYLDCYEVFDDDDDVKDPLGCLQRLEDVSC